MAVWDSALNTALYLTHLSNTYRYYRAHRRLPNYVAPKSFNEKIQWRKLFDRNPLFQCFVDKLAVRAYVAKNAPGLKLPKILWTGTDPNAIPYDDLPDRFVLKPSHRSGDIIFVRSRDDLDRARIAEACRRWLSTPFGRSRREWAYQNLKGQLIVEELLDTSPDLRISRDYRCFVINGALHGILVNAGTAEGYRHRFTGEGLVFDRSWSQLPYKCVFDEKPLHADVSRPEPLREMVTAAEALGREVDCVRVDLFVVGADAYFSELTIYQGSGMNEVAIDESLASPMAEPFDVVFGRLWTLPDIPLRDRIKHGFLLE